MKQVSDLSNLRILHTVDFFDPRRGYSEFYLTKKQVEYGINVSVITSDYQIFGEDRWTSGLSNISGVDVFRLKSAGKTRGMIWGFNPLKLAKILKKFAPNIVHCHGLFSPLSQEILTLKTKYNFSIVGDLISGIGDSILSGLGLTFLSQITKHFLKPWLIKRVDAFFACNYAIENWLRNYLQIESSKIFFIPLGADISLFKPDLTKREKIRRLYNIPKKDIVAIYTGKLLPSKRIHDLLKVSKLAVNKFKNFKIILVGEGPKSYEDKLKTLINNLKLTSHVLLLKMVHRTELPAFYNAADFAIWPGTFSISIVEAMACSLPIIIAKSNWTSHYLQYKNGFSFKTGDLDAFSFFLLRMIEDNQTRRNMGKQSLKLVKDKLNWNIISKKYIDIYSNLI
jgi:glycosyltransferase involved in cell wall biosynthesis